MISDLVAQTNYQLILGLSGQASARLLWKFVWTVPVQIGDSICVSDIGSVSTHLSVCCAVVLDSVTGVNCVRWTVGTIVTRPLEDVSNGWIERKLLNCELSILVTDCVS